MLNAAMEGNLDEYVRDSGGIGDILFNGRKVTKQMDFETRFGPRGYRFTIEPGAGESFALTNEARYYQHGLTGWWELGNSVDHNSLMVKEATGNGPDASR